MTPVILVTLLVVVFLLFLAFQFRWRYSLGGQPGQLVPVDLEAFENLTDPDEERYLRENLSPAEFRGVQRERLRATKMYVATLSENAGVLVTVGQSARHAADPEIASAGVEIVQKAIRLKVWCMLSLIRLNAAMVFPTALSPSRRIADQYLAVTYMAANLPRNLAA